jgi:hypothetical protein
MKKLHCILYFILFLLYGCDIQKKAQKTKADTEISSSIVSKKYRAGDSVSYRPGKIVLKDTTIYRVTKNNTRLETVYDSNGAIRDINCYAAQIEEITKERESLKQQLKEKSSEKIEKANFNWVLYLVLGFVLVLTIAFFFLFKTLNNHAAIIKKVTENL